MPERPAPEECAQCGAPIPRGAKACPECGADERTGWRETSLYDGLDLPDSAYEDESGPARSPRRDGSWFRWWVALLLVLVLVLGGWLLG